MRATVRATTKVKSIFMLICFLLMKVQAKLAKKNGDTESLTPLPCKQVSEICTSQLVQLGVSSRTRGQSMHISTTINM